AKLGVLYISAYCIDVFCEVAPLPDDGQRQTARAKCPKQKKFQLIQMAQNSANSGFKARTHRYESERPKEFYKFS
ncbi:MAG: hypothetical protein PHD48_12180, partial [Alphaproteobacteria bacterium]|nr:hypothetical protein [Alphaproteobacteria bacterium]